MLNRSDHYTEFADRMIRAVQGKARYGDKAANTLFSALVSPSQEAFTMLLYINGYENWVWMKNSSGTSDDTETDGCPGYLYTARSSELTSRNGGWSKSGMQKFNQLYKKVREEREKDDSNFEKEYMEHWNGMRKGRRKRKWDNTQVQSMMISDDLGDLLGEMEGDGEEGSGTTTTAV